MTLKEELSAVQPAIRGALDQVGFQTGIPYTLGSCQGGVIKLYEFCTFTVPDHEPLVLGVTFKQGESALELTLDLVEEDSGYLHWRVNLGELPEGEVSKLAEMAVANLPKPSIIKKILVPEPKPEEPMDQKQVLTKLVKMIQQGMTVDHGVELIEEVLITTVKKALAAQARNIVKYLEKYTG